MPQASPNQTRSSTGHVLLPAFNSYNDPVLIPLTTSRNLMSWTFGRGTVIWRIWPAVLLHTVFAAVVVTVSLKTPLMLGIPNVMLTVLGVVIGFVISYRASSGYDRYYQGRTAWSDLARTSRLFSRLVWIHVPLKLVPTPANPDGSSVGIDPSVKRRVMAEKRTALAMIEGFVVAVKHHLRGEMGIYYEDLYPLIKPLHDHPHHKKDPKAPEPPVSAPDTVSSPQAVQPAPEPTTPAPDVSAPTPRSSPSLPIRMPSNPVIPPINAYGTFAATHALHPARSFTSLSSASSDQDAHHPLLPGAVDPAHTRQRGLFGSVSADLVPFSSLWQGVGGVLRWRLWARRSEQAGMRDEEHGRGPTREEEGGIQRRWNGDDENGNPIVQGVYPTFVQTSGRSGFGFTHSKHRPRLAGGGENLPLEVLRSLSVWVSVLDERGVVPGPVLGAMYGSLASFEDSLCTLERILTTPLPFVYSVHIRTVWIYLFFLPFQLVDLFGWYAIPGVAIAAFIYLGMIAAGEEIEQPFGTRQLFSHNKVTTRYNDLDLDFFCRAIIHADIERVQRVLGPHVYLPHHHPSASSANASASDTCASANPHDFATDRHTRIEAVFGECVRVPERV
ncbi:Bestrophin, RFP-TM, chloride channel-domain-containing protein [Trametes elegans]|nr:Bestrophin, RFP-TM, chloride channel-domain-containing protein [Trametes elegans]